jgi:hypothetical protein
MGSCHRDGTFEFRAGDIAVPNRSPALTLHGAEFRPRSRQDNPVLCRVKYGINQAETARAVVRPVTGLGAARIVLRELGWLYDNPCEQPR